MQVGNIHNVFPSHCIIRSGDTSMTGMKGPEVPALGLIYFLIGI